MFKDLYTLLFPHRKQLLLVIIIGSVASLSTIGLMGLAGWLIASAALMPPLYTLSLAITGVRFCGIFRAVFRYLERYMSHGVGFKFFNLYRQEIITTMVDLVPFKVAGSKGNIYYALVEAIDKIRDGFLRYFLPPLTALVSGGILSIFSSYYSMAICYWILFLMAVFLFILPWWSKKLYGQIAYCNEDLTQEIMEMYDGQVEMQVYGYQQGKLLKAVEMVEKYQANGSIINKQKTKINFITNLAADTALVCTVGLLILQYNAQVLNGVMVIAMMLSVQALLELYNGIPPLMQWVWESTNSYALLTKYLQKREEKAWEQVADYEHDEYLAAKDLGFGYGDTLLQNLNWEIAKGDKVLILGSSGVGKSTLCYVLTKLLNYHHGSLGLCNVDYGLWSEVELRKHFAASFQDHHLFTGTIRENFQLLHPGITDEEIMASLQMGGSKIFTKLAVLDMEIADNGGNLSGGQRHGLQLALALAQARDIILLDEPTAGLDLPTAEHLLKTIMAEFNNRTVLIASHDLSLLHYFNKVIILGEKTVLEQGEIQDLLARENSQLNRLMKYRNLY